MTTARSRCQWHDTELVEDLDHRGVYECALCAEDRRTRTVASPYLDVDTLPAPRQRYGHSESDAFEAWWTREGSRIDPDTEDVPLFDKRKELCALAFAAATAQSRNYVADREVCPTQVTFTNGRVVRLVAAAEPWNRHPSSAQIDAMHIKNQIAARNRENEREAVRAALGQPQSVGRSGYTNNS